MFGQRGRRWALTAALSVATGGAMLLGVAGPAAADPAATGIPTEPKGDVSVPLLIDGATHSYGAIQLTITGQPAVPVFCIDYHTPLAGGQQYNEGTWDESEVPNLGKIQWVLAHGYPNADTTALLAAADVTMPGVKPAVETKLLYEGTQTAVWHFSDGVTLGDYKAHAGLAPADEYAVVKKIYDYLTSDAVSQPEPAAQLSVTPADATADAGAKAGPYTVSGPAGDIALSVTGGTAVDASGNAITKTTNGGQFWLTSTGAGTATATLTAQDAVSFGRVFLYSGGKDAHQKLILGSSVGQTVTATSAATFTVVSSPSPSATTSAPSTTPSSAAPSSSTAAPVPSVSTTNTGSSLPLTGSNTIAVVGVALLLLVGGGVALLTVRRRRTRFTS